MELLSLGLLLWIASSFLSSDTKGQKVAVSDFRYRYKNGTWRAYFHHPPKSRDHVLSDEDGYYVCWSDSLKSEEAARQVAQLWVNRYG
jgi:hypothetical protein